MSRPAGITEHSRRAMKLVVIVAILGTLVAFTSLSYSFSQDHAQRIECLHNQDEMREAVSSFASDNAGIYPARIWSVLRFYSDRPENFATCPANRDLVYAYDPKTGAVTCPDPAHRPH